jgi:hypothetical protein
MLQFPAGDAVRIFVSGNARADAVNAVPLTLWTLQGVSRPLTTRERLLIYWLDTTGPDKTNTNILDGAGASIPQNLIGAFSTLQVGVPRHPIIGIFGSMPSIYFPGSTDNSLQSVTFGYGEVVRA